MGDKTSMMKNHGILCAGDTVAETYRRLYKMERICCTQVLAMATGKELNVLSDAVVNAVLASAEENRTGARSATACSSKR